MASARPETPRGRVADRCARSGGLLPGPGKARNRLVADCGFLPRLPGSALCGVRVVEEEGPSSCYRDCPVVERRGAGVLWTARASPGSLWIGVVSFPYLAGYGAGRPGARFWRQEAVGRNAVRPAGPAAGHSDSRDSLHADHFSAADPGLQAGQRLASALWRTGVARGQCHSAACDEPGGRRGVQRDSLADEPADPGNLLRLFPGTVHVAPRGAGLCQFAYCHCGQCRAPAGHRPERSVLVSLACLVGVDQAMGVFPRKRRQA